MGGYWPVPSVSWLMMLDFKHMCHERYDSNRLARFGRKIIYNIHATARQAKSSVVEPQKQFYCSKDNYNSQFDLTIFNYAHATPPNAAL